MGAVLGGNGVSSGGGTAADVYTYTQGNRTRATVRTTGAALPPDFTGVTPTSLQQQMDGVYGKGVFNVASAGNPTPTTFVAEMDYCGPTKTVGAPVSMTVGGDTVTTSYEDRGPSLAGACAGALDLGGGTTTGLSTGSKVALGAGASLLTVAIISSVAGWSVTRSLDHVWNRLRGKRSR